MMPLFALLALAQPAPFTTLKTPTGVLQISCRQGECYWQQIRRVQQLPAAQGESLRKLSSRVGRSVHRGRIPPRYSSRLRVSWEAAPATDHVLCSRRRPATVRSEDGEFIVTRLNLTDMAGYEYSAATLYLQVCHNLAPGSWNERQLPRLGYRHRSVQQDRYPTLEAALAAL